MNVDRREEGDLEPVEVDPLLFTQALVNLIVNAAEAMAPSGGSLEITARRAYLLGHDEVAIRVADRGPGIPERQLGELFKPFFTTKPEGHGLGLAISQNILLEHGGRIVAQNRPPHEGTGAAFEVQLPMVRSSVQVLIADDEALIRQSLRTTLAREGFDVTVAASGNEAWLRFQEDRPDVVLLDLVLGDADGIELLRRMRQEAPDAKVILISAHGSIESAVAAMKLGGYDFIKKPFELEEIVGGGEERGPDAQPRATSRLHDGARAQANRHDDLRSRRSPHDRSPARGRGDREQSGPDGARHWRKRHGQAGHCPNAA